MNSQANTYTIGKLKLLCVGIVVFSVTLTSCDSPTDPDVDPAQDVTEPDFGVTEQQEAPDRYIVGLKPGKADVARGKADDVYLELDFGDIGVAVSGKFPEQALQGLENNPNVRYIEKEGIMQAHGHTVDEGDGDPSDEQVLPWGIDRVDAEMAHHAGETAEGAKITIIDSGIDPDHETLADNVAGGRAWTNCRGGQCSESWDDDNDHGTHVAGTAGAVNNDIGVVGVATEAELYAAKVLDRRGSGSFSDVADAIIWSADEGHDVANLSLGGGASSAVEDAVEYANDEGVLLIASAGNDGGSVNYPAAYEEVVAVSATDNDDNLAGFSSNGPEVELTAPGVSVLSSVPRDNYDSFNGTSMSAPHVAGTAAYLMADGMSHDDARGHLKETAEDIGLNDNEQGAGLVDVAAALDVDEEDDDPDDPDDPEDVEVTVETNEAENIGETAATLNGELTQLENAEEATVYFEWGESGDLSNTTSDQSLSSAGGFDETLSGLSSDTDYEFRAVAEAEGESDEGNTLTFTTDAEDDNGDVESDPEIDEFEVTARSSGPWNRAEVTWEVSHEDGALEEITTELLDGGTVLDSETTSISGFGASGEHELRTRDDADQVRIIVTDTEGNETEDIEDY